MKIFTGGRKSGKTTALIRESAETGFVIVCRYAQEAMRIQKQALELGIEIPEPMSFHDLLNRRVGVHYSNSIGGVLIDDAEELIQLVSRIPVKGIAIEVEAKDARITELEEFVKKCLDVIRCGKDAREELLKHDAELEAENKRLRELVETAFHEGIRSEEKGEDGQTFEEFITANGLDNP